MTFCRFGRHQVDRRDFIVQTRPDGRTFIYCTAHEPLGPSHRARLEAWVAKSLGVHDGA